MAFRCQKCNSEIDLDDSLRNISQAHAKLLVSKSSPSAELSQVSPTQFIPKDRLETFNAVQKSAQSKPLVSKDYTALENKPLSNDSAQSFVYLRDIEESNAQALDSGNVPSETDDQLPDFSKIKTLNQIFDILSTNQDISHPMCAECSDLLIENYKLKFDQSQREKEYYTSFLRKLKDRGMDINEPEPILDQKAEDSASELTHLEQSELTKLEDLESLEAKQRELTEQLKDLDKQLQDLSANQLTEVFNLKNSLSLDLSEKQKKLDQTKAFYQKHLDHLDNLRQYNVFAMLFDISFESNYGRINGFRLGYKVPWPECNAALGQIVSLLHFVGKKLEISWSQYKLVPLGSKSVLLKQGSAAGASKSHSSVLHLYSSNEFTIGKLFNFNKLDVPMIALLDIVSQVESKLSASEAELSLPYKIDPQNGTLGGKSIRVTSNAQWTESCKYLLVNLNWILSYTSAHSGP